MTSPLPPKRRDSRNLADLIRQDRMNLRQLGVGLANGRHPPLRPLKPQDSSGDEEDDVEATEILFCNTDIYTTGNAQDVSMLLTHEPIDGSEDVSWHPNGGGGIRLTTRQFSREGRLLRVPSFTGLAANDLIVCEYAYEDTDTTPEPATASLRGGNSAQGAVGTPALTGLALPGSTVLGDLIVVSAIGADNSSLTVADNRLNPIGNGMWIGYATTLANLNITAGANAYWAVACMVLNTNAVGWTSAVTSSQTFTGPGGALTVPTVSNVSAAVCAITDSHDTVHGATDTPTGYTTGMGSGSDLLHARADFWVTSNLDTSPAGTTTFTGGAGGVTAVVVGLIGP